MLYEVLELYKKEIDRLRIEVAQQWHDSCGCLGDESCLLKSLKMTKEEYDRWNKIQVKIGPITIFYDEIGERWNYWHSYGVLKLDKDNTEDGGYPFDTVDEAKQFLKENYGLSNR
jgi:hypothetical protein